MKTIARGSMIEIRAEKSGGVITEAFPTQRRTFRGSVLAAPADAGNWTEWTAGERAAWEAEEHVAAGRTPLTAIYENRGARLNESTGFYELNGFADITEAEMAAIYAEYNGEHRLDYNGLGTYSRGIRTLLPLRFLFGPMSVERLCEFAEDIEVVRFLSYRGSMTMRVTTGWGLFAYCPRLRRVEGHPLVFSPSDRTCFADAFTHSPNLEYFRVSLARPAELHLEHAPKLLPECAAWLARESTAAAAGSVVTLHPAAFARLDGETLTLAEGKGITFAEAAV